MKHLYSTLSGSTSCITDSDIELVYHWFSDLENIGYDLPKMRTRKQFAFLAQGSQLTETSHPRIQQRDPDENPNYDAYYLSFTIPSGDIFFSNSSWQQGRNALLRIALAKEVQPGYDYFVFNDEDVRLNIIDNENKHGMLIAPGLSVHLSLERVN